MADPLPTPPTGKLTREEYRRWAEAQPRGRFELVAGEVVAMSPERIAHARIKANAWLALRQAIAAAGALLGYVEETQKQRLPHLSSIALETSDGAIAMNAATRRHLELDTRIDGEQKHTLLGVLDSTVTPMGGRLLRRWLHRPLRDRGVIGQRQQAVEALVDSGAERDLRERFRGLGDVERILSRIALRSAHLDGATVRLFAGCGIVADSDPAAELAESEAKLVPVREALRAG